MRDIAAPAAPAGSTLPEAARHGMPDTARWRADPLADATIARILGACDAASAPSALAETEAAIAILNGQLAQWKTNAVLADWRAEAAVPPHIATALEAFLHAAMALPDWADPARIARAETVFMDMSMLSCCLLFCASLPECYVMPDLAAVLHASGQLERHTDYRVRSTAAMIFPVMMRGGLTAPSGGGVAQTLKVRLIHATIRHLVLRGAVAPAPQPCGTDTDTDTDNDTDNDNAAAAPACASGMHQALVALGWNVAEDGMPCSQEQLAYTLLTFNYVYLRGLHRLGIGLAPADEEAYLHAWNVMGHLLGIERGLMADTMAQAGTLFAALQADGRNQHTAGLPDPRPALGQALMGAMEAQIPLPLLKPFPVLLTRYLVGKATARDLGIMGRVHWGSRLAFGVGVVLARTIDACVRLRLPDFSLCRLVSRVAGYEFTVKLLMDQTRPLALPTSLLNQVNQVVTTWRYDPLAPKWINRLEARLTGRAPDPRAAPTPPPESPR